MKYYPIEVFNLQYEFSVIYIEHNMPQRRMRKLYERFKAIRGIAPRLLSRQDLQDFIFYVDTRRLNKILGWRCQPLRNGIYKVAETGDAQTPWKLNREAKID